MAITVQQTRKIGGSLMIRIPKDIIAMEQIDEGERVEIEIRKLKRDCFGILPRLTSLTKKEKIDIHG